MKLFIKKFDKQTKLPWRLLLLADPSQEMVETYLKNSSIFLAYLENKLVGEYVLTPLSSDAVELKNIAIEQLYQGKGFGKKLVMDAIQQAKRDGMKRIEVGTGNSSMSQLALYQKCGFRIVGIDKDFFVKNYQEEIFENDIRCTDMIRLVINF